MRDLKVAFGVAVRTFAALAGAALLAAQGYDWVSGDAVRNNGYLLGLALLAAFVGALVAGGWSYVGSPATTPLGKAIRAAVEKIVGGIGAVAFNSAADVVEFSRLLPALGISAVLAFAITFASYVSPPTTEPAAVAAAPTRKK